MQLTETLLVGTLLLLVTSLARQAWMPLSQGLLLATVVLALCHALSGGWRWPVLLAYLGLLLAGYCLIHHLRQSSTPPVWLLLLSALPTLLAGLLLAGMPMQPLPSPQGRFQVGQHVFLLEDSSRTEPSGGEQPLHRGLLVKTWYPAQPPASPEAYPRAPLWSELYTQPQFRLMGKVFGFFSKLPTHSRQAPPVVDSQRFPVIYYHHAIVSHPSENSLLMEELASRGYIVFSISHINQMAAFRALQQQGNRAGTDSRRILASIRAEARPHARQALARQYYEDSRNTRRLVMTRVADQHFVRQALQACEQLAPLTRQICAQADNSKTAIMGHSLGGAVATEYGKQANDIKAIVNIDGGLFGDSLNAAPGSPFLQLATETTHLLNAFHASQARHDYYEFVFADTRHGDFTDQSRVLPLFKWLGILGKAKGTFITRQQNRLVAGFLDYYLKGSGDRPQLEPGVTGIRMLSNR